MKIPRKGFRKRTFRGFYSLEENKADGGVKKSDKVEGVR